MKTGLLFSLLLISIAVFSQSNSIPDPAFPGRPYYLKDSSLQSLEKAEANFDMKAVGGGFGGTEEYLTVFGAKSTVRFSAGSIPQLYIKIEGSGDPEDQVSISTGEIKKDRRRFKTASTSLSGKAKNVSAVKVTVSLKKIKDNLYQIVFDAPLARGEYAFMPKVDLSSMMGGGKMSMFCFGID